LLEDANAPYLLYFDELIGDAIDVGGSTMLSLLGRTSGCAGVR
jgi:hypothetical protein